MQKHFIYGSISNHLRSSNIAAFYCVDGLHNMRNDWVRMDRAVIRESDIYIFEYKSEYKF